jgi:hypothetical protein
MLRQSIFSVCLFITASGATAQPIDPFFPMIGGSMGEIMRLNVKGLGGPDTKCVAEIGFRNAQGVAVGPSRRVELAPDYAAFLDLNLNTLVSRLGERVELRGWLRHTRYSGPCAASVELFEHITARTMVAQTPSFHSPPDPDLPPVGGALGQTVRLSAVAVGNPDINSYSLSSRETPIDRQVLDQEEHHA